MSSPQALVLDKAKIIAQLTSLSQTGTHDGWTLDYDPEVDQLFYGHTIMPKKSFIFQVNDEVNLFVSKDSTVHGMFVEYFKHNYLEHNKELKPVLEVLEGTDHLSREDEQIERVALEKDLFLGTIASIFDRESLVTVA